MRLWIAFFACQNLGMRARMKVPRVGAVQMGDVVRFRMKTHARHPLGRGTSEGQSPPAGQCFENHSSARSSRRTLISAPPSSAANFLPSSSARDDTVESGTPSNSPYRRAIVSSWSISDMSEISVNLPVLSTAILPDARIRLCGHSTGMDLATIYDNIQRLLRAKKLSANKASLLAGKPDAIRNIQRKLSGEIKGHGVTVDVLAAIAKVLGTTVDELQTPRDRLNVRPVSGLKEMLLAKISWLDKEREQALMELEALEEAEAAPPLRRRKR
jgi:transcriptional regulator with XRE-family HTH domain